MVFVTDEGRKICCSRPGRPYGFSGFFAQQAARLLSTAFGLTGYPMTHEDRLSRASISLEGLAIGDAFGQMFSAAPRAARTRVQENRLPPRPWCRTDDTEMALAIVEVLNRFGRIDQDALARRFAERFDDEPDRGYGKMARIILRSVLRGGDWKRASAMAFGEAGSKGNGGSGGMNDDPMGRSGSRDHMSGDQMP